MIGDLKKLVIKFIYPGINLFILVALRATFFWKNKRFKKNKKCVAIMCDYLLVDVLLGSIQLNNYDVGLITTKRYHFISLLKKIGFIKFIIFQDNFANNKRDILLEKCRDFKVDIVLLQAGDFMVPMTNYLNRKLNNKGNSELASLCSLDKYQMRKTLNAHGVSEFKVKKIFTENDIEKINFFPCVLKPNIGTYSEGVLLVNSKDELKRSLKNSLFSHRKTEFETSFIVEEFVQGRQFDVEGIIHNGTMHVLCIVEENYEGFFPEFDMNWYLFNSILDKRIRIKILEVVATALNVSELKHGAFHCELRVDGNKNIKILEFSNRMGGGFETTILEATGNNFADVYIQSMLQDKVVIKENNNIHILEKYFKTFQKFKEWKDFLKDKNINFSGKQLTTNRKNKYYIKVVTKDIDNICLISDNFKLGL